MDWLGALRSLFLLPQVFVREGVKIRDNVTVILEDIHTGEQQVITQHNTPLDYAFSAFSQWIGGKNNSGQNALVPPSQIQLGSGTGTPAAGDAGLFTPIPNSLTSLSYAQINQPASGTTTLIFQIPAGKVTSQVTEAWMQDIGGNGWFHTMFTTPFTPTSSQQITFKWEVTTAA